MVELIFSLRVGTMPENSAEEAVLYGDNIPIKDAPFFAFLPTCGAAILSPIWLVTSARCMKNRSVYPGNTIWAGGDTVATSHSIGISETFIHPDFITFSQNELTMNDVALLKLKEPLNFTDKIKAIDLPVNDNFTEDIHVLVGRVIDKGSEIKSLRKLNLYRVGKKPCLKSLSDRNIQFIVPYDRLLDGYAFCAERAELFSMICVGQPGSPVVQNNTLRGIVSFFVNQNCRDSKINFYTNIFYFVNWIKMITRL